MSIEIADSWKALEKFFELHCQTRRKHGLPPQSISFFRSIHRHVFIRGKGCVVTASVNSHPIAAAVFFQEGKEVVYKFGASDDAHLELRGNNLVMWNAMKYFAIQGCTSLHMGRTSRGQEGLRRYKLGWGALERQLEYFRYDLAKKSFVKTTDLSNGWHNRVFRNLPFLICRGLGTALYRHLS